VVPLLIAQRVRIPLVVFFVILPVGTKLGAEGTQLFDGLIACNTFIFENFGL